MKHTYQFEGRKILIEHTYQFKSKNERANDGFCFCYCCLMKTTKR